MRTSKDKDSITLSINITKPELLGMAKRGGIVGGVIIYFWFLFTLTEGAKIEERIGATFLGGILLVIFITMISFLVKWIITGYFWPQNWID